MRCLVLGGSEPIEHEPGHLAVGALASIPMKALLVEPPIEVRSGSTIALDDKCVITGPERPPHLMATEELDEIDGDLGVRYHLALRRMSPG